MKVAWTIRGERQLGKMCSSRMRPSPAPALRAASVKSWSLRAKTDPGQPGRGAGCVNVPKAMTTFKSLGPKAALMAMASKMAGKAIRASITRMITLSRRG